MESRSDEDARDAFGESASGCLAGVLITAVEIASGIAYLVLDGAGKSIAAGIAIFAAAMLVALLLRRLR